MSTLPRKRVKPRTSKNLHPRKPEAIKVFPDGRECCNTKTIEGRMAYRGRVSEMVTRQGFRCLMCHCYITPQTATFDHENGRGAGKRDDRIEVAGVLQNAALCEYCNTSKGSVRIAYHQ